MSFGTDMKNSKAGKSLLIILVIAFIISSLGGIVFMTNKYNVIVINDKKVNINEFVKILNNEKQRIYLANQDEKQIDFLNSKEFMVVTLHNLLQNELINKEIETHNIAEPDSIVLSKISKEQYFYTNNKFDIEKFHKLLEQYKITEYDFIKMSKNDDNINFLISLINNIKANNYFVDKIFQNENKYKSVSIFSINKKLIKTDKVSIKDEDIKKYYDDNIDSFTIPETRKVDYIELENFTDSDNNKIKELLLTSDSISNIASNINTTTKTLGYINNNDINNLIEKYGQDINNIFSYKINDFSKIIKIDNKLYVFSVVDIKDKKIQTINEVKNNIKETLINDVLNRQYVAKVSNYVEVYSRNGYNNKTLLNKGFTVKNAQISKHNKDYNVDFVKNVLDANIKSVTKVFTDNDSVYFAYIQNEGLINESNDNFIDKESVKYELANSINNSIHKTYIDYLQNIKYKVKLNYKLLDLIR